MSKLALFFGVVACAAPAYAIDPNRDMAPLPHEYSIIGKAPDGHLYEGEAAIIRSHGRWKIKRTVADRTSVEKAHFTTITADDIPVLSSTIVFDGQRYDVAYELSSTAGNNVNLVGWIHGPDGQVGSDVLIAKP